ncbi:cytochrome c [Lacibacter cauensis]|nr:cytochrome c [Lacibacter cauensis]
MNRIIILLLVVFTTVLSSCYYDAADLLYPSAGTCDTATNVSYNQTIVPLFQQQCYSCHNNTSTGGGVLMGSYTNDKTIAVNGKLYGSVTHASGYSAMPKGMAKLNNCQLSAIKKWIDAGAPNN